MRRKPSRPAVALIKTEGTEGLDEVSRTRITREAQTIGGLSLADGDVISMGRTEFTMMAPVK